MHNDASPQLMCKKEEKNNNLLIKDISHLSMRIHHIRLFSRLSKFYFILFFFYFWGAGGCVQQSLLIYKNTQNAEMISGIFCHKKLFKSRKTTEANIEDYILVFISIFAIFWDTLKIPDIIYGNQHEVCIQTTKIKFTYLNFMSFSRPRRALHKGKASRFLAP